MSQCVTCSSDPLPPCSCSSDQECIRINQSCDQCARNVCQDLDGSTSGGSSAGATAGGAVGGAAAGIILVTLLYVLLKRRRASNLPWKPFLRSQWGAFKHTRSPSRNLGMHERGEEMDTLSRPVSKAFADRASRLSKRVSIHVDDDDQLGDDPFETEAEVLAGPHSSLARSSQITPIISLAHLPPDANSMSIEDGQQRTVLGERRSVTPLGVIPEGRVAETVPGKHLTVKKKKSKPKPLRPSREPGLDLSLPTPSPTSSPATPNSAPPTLVVHNPDSRFSSSTWATGYTGMRDSSSVGSDSAQTRPPSAFSAASSHNSFSADPPRLVQLASGAQRVEMTRADPIVLHTGPGGVNTLQNVASNPFADAGDDGIESAMNQIADLDAARPNDELQDAMQLIANLDPAKPNDELQEAMHQIAELQPARPHSTRDSVMSLPESNRSTLLPRDSSSIRTPSTAFFSALDGIPFLSAGQTDRTTAVQSGLFPRPPMRSSTLDQSRPTSAASFATSTGAWAGGSPSMFLDPHAPPVPNQGRAVSMASSLGRPSSGLTEVGDITRRSGFSSGGALADVPFQLAFPGERNSTATDARMSSFSGLSGMVTARSSTATQVPPMPIAVADLVDPFADPQMTVTAEADDAPMHDIQLDDHAALSQSAGGRQSTATTITGRASISSLASLAAHFVSSRE